MKTLYKFNYSESMEKYRKENNINNKIEVVKLASSTQLKNKFPKFTIIVNSEYGTCENIVKTRKLFDNTFQVIDGYGQLSFGIIEQY